MDADPLKPTTADHVSATDHEKSAKKRHKKSRTPGYQQSLRYGLATVAVSLCITVGLTIAAHVRSAPEDGYRVLWNLKCDKAQNVNMYLHLVINILSTLVLGASNYAMQVLSAPTRAEVDAAHAKRRWVNIGILSFGNLWYIRGWRKWLCVALAVSSLPVHLLCVSPLASPLRA